ALAAQASMQLTPGVSLNREQVAALTSNIVWLEETIVNGQKVLAPRLYMAPANRSTIQLAGSRITGQDVKLEAGTIENEGAITAVASLDLSAAENLTNRGGTLSGEAVTLRAGDTFANESGTVSGGTVAITAKNVRNETLKRSAEIEGGSFEVAQRRASISAGSSLSITAEEDIVSTGGDLASEGDASLSAGRDIRLEALKTEAGFNMDSDVGTTRVDATRYDKGTVSAEGNLSIESGRNIAVIGTDVAAGEDATLNAGENVVIGSVQNRLRSENTQAFKGESRHSIKDNSQTVGSTISAGNNVTIGAGEDASIKASSVTSGGDLALSAEGDINITGDKAVQSEYYKSTSKRFLSRKSHLVDGQDEVYSGSLLMSDGDVSITSGKDVTVKGSTVISENDTTIEGDTVALAADTTSSEFLEVKKKSGFFAERAQGGFGVTAGYRSQKDEFSAQGETAIVSSVGAGGSVTINARDDIRSEGAVVAAEDDITLKVANDIELLSTYDLAMQSQRHEKKQIGVTISVFENVSAPVKTLIDTPRAALSGKGNAGFKAISGVSAGLRALDAANSLKSMAEGGTVAGVRLGIGVSSEKSRDSQQSSIAQVSNLSAGNDLTLEAGRDIVSEGAQIDVGNDATLTAG
ncbi:hemagglutinin repeat-containing protein, partial [Roseibium sp. TrichSKD4]|uniref:hemagglutinin repeat-containing protein n=1 Tax=Roseibium sp. TrichSKD4 TaxID=744980 RepID=UPI0014392D0F